MDAGEFLAALGLGPALLAPSRANGFANMLEAMRRRARLLVSELPRFPSLRITADALEPQGERRHGPAPHSAACWRLARGAARACRGAA